MTASLAATVVACVTPELVSSLSDNCSNAVRPCMSCTLRRAFDNQTGFVGARKGDIRNV